ncbi:MAG: PilX N-terminal domain-containing pilus assembly protein [Pseudomonadota bacterium]
MQQRGAALVTALVLLSVMTVLSLGAMGMSTLELVMAGNYQSQERAFEAAEAIIERELSRTDMVPLDAPGQLPVVPENQDRDYIDGDGRVVATASGNTAYRQAASAAGWQLGGSVSYSAYHFQTTGAADGIGGTNRQHQQGYYVVGPALN